MSFAALPNELIFEIANRIRPDDIESYELINHRFRDIARPVIREHRQLKDQYTKLFLGHVSAAKLLYEMCARPWIQWYPRVLTVQANRRWRSFENPRRDEDKQEVWAISARRSVINSEDLIELLRRTRLISEPEIHAWLDATALGDEDYLFALILACLPNLERLIIRLDYQRLEQVKEMIRRIKRQPVSTDAPRALPRLIDARVLEREGSNTPDLEIFPLIASLPGIRTLHARNLAGFYRACFRDGWPTYAGASMTITHISLSSCGMSSEGLEKICGSIKGLRSFKYVAHRAGWGLNNVAILLKSAHHTLEELEMSTGSGESRFMGTLRQFTVLRHLTVDSGMLIRHRQMQRAVEILPASIETATLCGNSLTPAFEERFLADLYRPSFSFPRLRRLSVDDSWGKRDIGKERLKFQEEFHRQSSWSQRQHR